MPVLESWKPAGAALTRPGRHDHPVGSFVIGVTKPTTDTVATQVQASTAGMTTISSPNPYIVSSANVTITDTIFTVPVHVRAGNVKFQRCIFKGSVAVPTTATGLIVATATSCVNLIVEDSWFKPQTPNWYWDSAIQGHDYTARRCLVQDTTDGFTVYNTSAPSAPANVLVEACCVDRLAYWSPSPTNSDNRTHNDAIQVQGNGYVTIRGCNFQAFASAVAGNGWSTTTPAPIPSNYLPSITGQGIGITPNVSAVTNVLIEQNWLDGGAQSITVVPNTYGVGSSFGEIRNNRFGRQQALKSGLRRPVIVDPSCPGTNIPGVTGTDTNGNVYDDNGSPITIYRMAG